MSHIFMRWWKYFTGKYFTLYWNTTGLSWDPERRIRFGSWRVDGEDVLVIEETACETISSWAESEQVIVDKFKEWGIRWDGVSFKHWLT